MYNEIKIEFPNKSCNERLARGIVSAFVLELDPTASAMAELKTAVSEAVTNAIIHAYPQGAEGRIEMVLSLDGRNVQIKIIDFGCGIADIEKAMEPMYTCSEDRERSGMGFTVMEAFSDGLEVVSRVGEGTTVILKKSFV